MGEIISLIVVLRQSLSFWLQYIIDGQHGTCRGGWQRKSRSIQYGEYIMRCPFLPFRLQMKRKTGERSKDKRNRINN